MVPNTAVAGIVGCQKNKNRKVIIKNQALFTDCISKISNTKIENPKEIDVVMSCLI